ncbi:EcsC family protein [Micromonospora sp. WMMD956]|uniref:EcsC family protein n=1 Tax=Micromonospora sp. WMMD956 TaxID=3016108 RepID=UPI002416BDD3|nr:EcsC family protein [Micromonospora sp. WMMD956]MDG4816696.1 EcsC family protein [Micromonospora sp. WMMD956]
MSDYEARAWSALLDSERKRRDGLKARATSKIALVAKRAGEQLRKAPGAEKALELGDETIVKALQGGFKAIFLPAVRSASLEKRVERLRRKHQDLGAESLFESLDLKDLDQGRPMLTVPFIGVLQSGVASVAVTGAVVSTTVSGGTTAAVAVAAVASDAVLSLALLGRAVAEVAVHYGYDPREPEEELFLMGVLNYSTASSSTSKTAALASLSRLTQQMMRRATWKQLGKEPLVPVLVQIFKLLGLRLTKARLAQVVPIAGVVLAAGLSFNMLRSAVDDATRLYRARYLAEKHGLSWEAWIVEPTSVVDAAASEPVVDATTVEIDGLLDEAAAGKEEDGDGPPAKGD